MKNQLRSFAAIMLASTFVIAQNPKTNAGNLNNKSPKEYQAPSLPKLTPQLPIKDSVKIITTESDEQGRYVKQTNYVINKDSVLGNSILFGLGLIVGIPQNAFREANNKNAGIGFGISCFYNFMGTKDKEKKPINIYLGGTFEYLYFGGESNSFSFDDPYPYNAIYNTVKTSVNVNMYTLLLASRIEFFNGPIVPFIEIAVGGRLLDGNENLTIDRSIHYGGVLPGGVSFTPTSSSENTHLESDFVGTYGYGGGFRIGKGAFKVELKLMNMMGTNGKYIDKESIKIDSNNNITYSTKTSTTDMLIPQISVTGTF